MTTPAHLASSPQFATVADAGISPVFQQLFVAPLGLQVPAPAVAARRDSMPLSGYADYLPGRLRAVTSATARIRELLDWAIRADRALVAAGTTGPEVTLAGTASEAPHGLAAAGHRGTTSPPPHPLPDAYRGEGRGLDSEAAVPRRDEDMVAAVRAAIHRNPHVHCSETLVQTLDGIVTLAGTVSTLHARQETEREARRVPGVRAVHNLLKVRPECLVPDAGTGQAIVAAPAHAPCVGHC